MFTQGMMLDLPDRTKEFILFCDASAFAVGAALHQTLSSAVKEALVYWSNLLVDTVKPILL
jgi:hypothetical protein